jgi:hypothetical protein
VTFDGVPATLPLFAVSPPDGAATIESLPLAKPSVPYALPSTPKPA